MVKNKYDFGEKVIDKNVKCGIIKVDKGKEIKVMRERYWYLKHSISDYVTLIGLTVACMVYLVNLF